MQKLKFSLVIGSCGNENEFKSIKMAQ